MTPDPSEQYFRLDQLDDDSYSTEVLLAMLRSDLCVELRCDTTPQGLRWWQAEVSDPAVSGSGSAGSPGAALRMAAQNYQHERRRYLSESLVLNEETAA